ncbi:MAG: hypothetical protein KC413_21710 [Anaerolineales bacterium]|nr:hypothetical protein [Anaerolineales bacterium]
MKRGHSRFVGLLFLLALVIALFVSQGGYANEQKENEKNQSQLVLHIPPGIRLSGIALENKPDDVVLNEDGTLPEIIIIPGNVVIPDKITLPERVVSIPEIDGDGNEYTVEVIAPEVTFPIVDYVKQLQSAPIKDRALGKSQATATVHPYYVSVQQAFSGHCDQGTNYSYTTVPSNSTSFVANSSLPTWVPGDGSASNWNFAYAAGSTRTTLCIPKSLYFIYILPVYSTDWYAGMLVHTAYQNTSNWTTTYYN